MSDVCGKTPEQFAFGGGYTGSAGGWTDSDTFTVGTIYTLYKNKLKGDNTIIDNPPGKYCSVMVNVDGVYPPAQIIYVAYISTQGVISEWHTCP